MPAPRRLAAMAPDLDVVAFDRPERLEALRRELPGAECRHWDPSAGTVAIGRRERLRGAIVVCDGLIETLDNPAPLFAALRAASPTAACAIVVTADRDLVAPRGSGRGPLLVPLAELRAGLGPGPQLTLTGSPARRAGLDLRALGRPRRRDAGRPLPAGCLRPGPRNLELRSGVRRARRRRRAAEPLRICIASYEFVGPTSTGGIGTAYTSLAEALAKAGHEVTVLLPGCGTRGRASFSHWEDHYARRGFGSSPPAGRSARASSTATSRPSAPISPTYGSPSATASARSTSSTFPRPSATATTACSPSARGGVRATRRSQSACTARPTG